MADSVTDQRRARSLGAFLGLLALACPEDASQALGELGDAAVASGIADAAWPLPAPVTDHVIRSVRSQSQPQSLSASALARRLMDRRRIRSQQDDALRRALLGLADPAVDMELFGLGVESVLWWVRVAILRDRRGQDGAPVIPVALKRQLLWRALGIDNGRRPGAVRPGINEIRYPFPSMLVHAADPDLVRAALMLIDWNPFQAGGEPWQGGSPAAQDPSRTRWWTDLRLRVAHAVDAVERGDAQLSAPEPLSADHLQAAEALRKYVADGWQNLEYGPYVREADSPDWDKRGSGSARYAMPWDLVLERARRVGGERCIGVDEAVRRDDCPPEVRAEIRTIHPRYAAEVARPDVEAMHGLNAALTAMDAPPVHGTKVFRTLALRGLAYGSLDPVEIVEGVGPAAAVVSLAVPHAVAPGLFETAARVGPTEVAVSLAVPGAGGPAARGSAAIQSALRSVAASGLGRDPEAWFALIVQIAVWPGSFASLVRRIAEEGPELFPPNGRAPRRPTGVDAAAVLLALAPDGIAELFVADVIDRRDRVHEGVVTRILDRGPLSRVLVEHGLGPHGTRAMRLALARNPDVPEEALWHLAFRDPIEPDVLGAAYVNPRAGHDLRTMIVTRSEGAGGVDRRLAARLSGEFRTPMLAPMLASRDPVLLNSVLRKLNTHLHPVHRLLAYAALAEEAGPEVVWALEVERTGSTLSASDEVRASMGVGNAAPLLAAAERARIDALPGSFDDLATAPPDLTDDAFREHSISWPDVDLVRENLDGRPERWCALATLVQEDAQAVSSETAARTSLHDAVRRVVAATGGGPR